MKGAWILADPVATEAIFMMAPQTVQGRGTVIYLASNSEI
jgi:hypothetical protein